MTDPCFPCCPSVGLLGKPRAMAQHPKECWGCSGTPPAGGGGGLSPLLGSATCPVPLSPGRERLPLYLHCCHVHVPLRTFMQHLSPFPTPRRAVLHQARVAASGRPGVRESRRLSTPCPAGCNVDFIDTMHRAENPNEATVAPSMICPPVSPPKNPNARPGLSSSGFQN